MERKIKSCHQHRPSTGNCFSSTFIILLMNVIASTNSMNSYEAPLSPGVPAPPMPPGVPPDGTNDNNNNIVASSAPDSSPSFMEIPPSPLQFLPMPPPPPPHFGRAFNWAFNFFMNAPTGPMMPPMPFPMFIGSSRPNNAAFINNPDLSGQNGFIPSSDRIVWPDDNNI